MDSFKRFPENPILLPQKTLPFEAAAAFNPCVAADGKTFHMVYRALSDSQDLHGVHLNISSVGYATGNDPIHFGEHRQIIKPEEEWEKFGCEDPRITLFEGTYYIFYTALSQFPFSADGIKVGVATTKDFEHFEKHPVTPFNAKAMMLFPDRVQGKMVAIVTVNTDRPPAKIALALFDEPSDIWSEQYWKAWYASLDDHIIPLLRHTNDQIEAGAPPLKTDAGWIFTYSYITNYRNGWNKVFGIELALLDLKNPEQVLGRTSTPVLMPEKDYEKNGMVPNIVFPSGALITETPAKKLLLYYGAADTTGAVAGIELDSVLETLKPAPIPATPSSMDEHHIIRFSGNPIIEPRAELAWEAKATFNPAALYDDGKIHLVYRAMSEDNTSVLGYAVSHDGFHIDDRLSYPIYTPRESFETKRVPGGNSGCEDPRITMIGNTIYMHYTAFNGIDPPRVAVTSIRREDFLNHQWNWERPMLISPPNYDDKDACVLPKKIENKYIIFHRLGNNICIDAVPDLRFSENRWLEGMTLFGPRKDKWDNAKIGIAAPPIETPDGWLLFYHGVSQPGSIYKLGAALLALDNPVEIIARSMSAILEPEMHYEREGIVPNVVFPCGVVVINGILFVYYGGADRVIGVATANLAALVAWLKTQK